MIDALPAAAAPAALSIEEAASGETASAQDQDADAFGWLSSDMSEGGFEDLPAGITDALGGDLGDFDWGVALSVGAATMVLVVIYGMARRGKKRRAQTVTAQDGAFAIQPPPKSKTAEGPASPPDQTRHATASAASPASPRSAATVSATEPETARKRS